MLNVDFPCKMLQIRLPIFKYHYRHIELALNLVFFYNPKTRVIEDFVKNFYNILKAQGKKHIQTNQEENVPSCMCSICY